MKTFHLKCRKCNGICKFSGKQTHLCGKQHECQDEECKEKDCEKGGYCEIESSLEVNSEYQSKYQTVKYNSAKTIKPKKKNVRLVYHLMN